MLSAEDRADVAAAHTLGLISESLLAELNALEQRAMAHARAEAEAARERQSKVSELAFQIRLLEISLTIARRDVELAREKSDDRSAVKAQKAIDGYERSLFEERSKLTVMQQAPAACERERPDIPVEAAEALALLRELRALEKSLVEVASPCNLAPARPIDELDARLCLAWVNTHPRLAAVAQLQAMKSFEAGRLLSARNAEKVAMRYYESHGLDVRDVSSEQLTPGATSWREFDLLAGSKRIDVKNARESLNSDHFVEQFVPESKLARGGRADVRIAGVVSPYLPIVTEYFRKAQRATVLGEVDARDMRELTDWANRRFSQRLDLEAPWRPDFVPGWLFEFPEMHYPGRLQAIQAAPEMIRKLIASYAYSCEIPAWLWVYSNERFPEGLPTAPVLRDLRELRDSIGISRRSLYVLALGLAVEEARSGAEGESKLTALMEACKLPSSRPGAERLKPLGLDDPLGYVIRLASLLSDIVETIRRQNMDVVSFRLASPAILQGLLAAGKRVTLLAYCGGWQRTPVRARCGTSPLSIAKHAPCTSCGHLTCSNCGHCSNLCEKCEPRQAAVARKKLSPNQREAEENDDGNWVLPS